VAVEQSQKRAEHAMCELSTQEDYRMQAPASMNQNQQCSIRRKNVRIDTLKPNERIRMKQALSKQGKEICLLLSLHLIIFTDN
jgi:hypothetical protein